MKKYLIKKTIIYDGKQIINYHSKYGISADYNLEIPKAFYDYDDALEELIEIQYYDEEYYNKGFDFKYEIIEVE